ncbi:MAG: hypothetical protein ACI3X4_00045 [Bacteroidaceae bacterium]
MPNRFLPHIPPYSELAQPAQEGGGTGQQLRFPSPPQPTTDAAKCYIRW